MRRLACTFLLMCLYAGLAWAQKERLFTQVFSKQEFAQRRARLMETIGPNAVAVLRGNEGMPGYVSFRQGNDFFYLTGVEAPGAIVVLDGGSKRTILFLPPRNERRERAEGALLVPDDRARELTGIAEIMPVGELTSVLSRLDGTRPVLYAPMAPQELADMSRDLAVRYNLERMDDPWDGQASREARFIAKIHERFPGFAIKDLSPILDKMRLVKSAEEIAVLRKSSELAALGLMEAMRSTQPGQYEYELSALARFVFMRNGAQGDSYYALTATGRNAYMPHYHAGQSQLKDGEMLLLDYAPEFHYYQADVTRMWPVNGKFSPEQRELYGFYLGCYQAIMKHIRPRVPVSTIGQEAARDMEALLARSKFSNPRHQDAAKQFVATYKQRAEGANFRLGHWVGMATHDVGGYVDQLQPGMVFTVEPALTVPEDETYVRLEDMLLVTDSGVENLSASAPVEIDAIEKLMKEQGLLKRYPRLLAHDAVRPARSAPANAGR